MSRPTLAAHVHVRDSDGVTHAFAPGAVPPAWAAAQITNPRAWAGSFVDDSVDDEPVTVDTYSAGQAAPIRSDVQPAEMPPRSGAGSGRQAWADHAERLGIVVDDTVSRDQIIEAVMAAELAG